MTTALINLVWPFLSLSWLTGPIFSKELRVSSRRRRNYVLRSAILLLLTLLIASSWLMGVLRGSGSSAAYRISRMAEVGKYLILTITWFQFIVAQLIAIVMLSNSISDEIRRGTLEVLMTTPINSLQIVLGKLFSKFLQLILLLALTLPLLAVVRVFGGIQWDYLVCSWCITLTAMLFAGSLSMLLSIKIHRQYSVIFVMLVLLIVAYCSTFFLSVTGIGTTQSILLLSNPSAAMWQASNSAYSAAPKAGSILLWPFHCLIMLGASSVVLAASVFMIRRGALSQLSEARGGTVPFFKRMITSRRHTSASSVALRPIEGSAMIWKELGRPVGASIKRNLLIFGVLTAALFLAYAISAFNMRTMFFCYIYTSALWLITAVRTGTMAAISIAREKEGRTWPILLSTCLDDKEIVRGKATAVLCQNLAPWAVLAVHSVSFLLLFRLRYQFGGFSIAWQFVQTATGLLGLIGYLTFIIGAGLYSGLRLKSSTAAVMATLGSMIGLYILKYVISLIVIVFRPAMAYVVGPYVTWISSSLVSIVCYAGVGVFLLRRTKSQLRRHTF
ncbi:MAG: ABC transporter permease subunit [Planctomycetota bacterium]